MDYITQLANIGKTFESVGEQCSELASLNRKKCKKIIKQLRQIRRELKHLTPPDHVAAEHDDFIVEFCLFVRAVELFMSGIDDGQLLIRSASGAMDALDRLLSGVVM